MNCSRPWRHMGESLPGPVLGSVLSAFPYSSARNCSLVFCSLLTGRPSLNPFVGHIRRKLNYSRLRSSTLEVDRRLPIASGRGVGLDHPLCLEYRAFVAKRGLLQSKREQGSSYAPTPPRDLTRSRPISSQLLPERRLVGDKNPFHIKGAG